MTTTTARRLPARPRGRPALTVVGARRRTVLYARVSKPNKARETTSVDEQVDVLRQRAAREGWEVVAEPISDRAVSASRYATKARENWPQVMALIAAGRVDRLALWELSRASRDRRVFAALFAACEETGTLINVDGRDFDLDDPEDAQTLDFQALMAVAESGRTSKRVRRSSESRAREGKLATSLPFGYQTVYVTGDDGKPVKKFIEHPDEGKVVRDVVRRLLAHDPAERIAKDLNAAGVLTRTGKQWVSWTISAMGTRPTYARLRVHRGEVLYGDDGQPVKGAWPELVSEADHYALCEMYDSADRDKYRNSKSVRFLGSGLYKCGRCGGRMRSTGPRKTGGISSYTCGQCFRVNRRTEAVDELVGLFMVELLGSPDLLDAWKEPEQDDRRDAAAAEITRLNTRLARARTAFLDAADGDEEEAQKSLVSLQRDVEQRIAELRREVERPRLQVPALLAEAAGERAAAWWKAAPITAKRSMVDLLAEVTLLPGRPGRPARGVPIDPDSVVIEPRKRS